MTSPEPPRQSVAPTLVRVFYHTPFAPHVQNIGCTTWSNGDDLGQVVDWSGGDPVDLLTMMTALLAEEKVLLNENGAFDLAFVYTFDTPESPAILRKIHNFATAGTSTSTSWAEAVQLNLNGKDTAGNTARLTMLDVATGNDFGKKYLSDILAAVQDIWQVYSDVDYGFSSRAGFRPDSLISQTVNINEKLRRSYRLT